MMTMRMAICAAALFLAACASNEAAAPPAAAPAPPPPVVSDAPAPPADNSLAAPGVTLPPERPSPVRSGDVTVPGGRERPVEAPEGDPRTEAERMRDIRAWDQCITRAQGAMETDPSRPQLTSPEDLCAQSLGMASRRAVPESRRNWP